MDRMLRLVLDTIPVRVFWKDRDSRYLGCNTHFAQDAGRTSPDDLVGLTDFDMGWGADQAELYRADDRQVMESGVPRLGYEEPQTTPDGSTIWLRTSKIPLRDPEGAVIGMLGVYEDISAEKKAEADRLGLQAQLERSRKMEAIGRLAGGVAHDFNNLLTVIGGYTEFLLAMGTDDPQRQEALQEIDRAQRSAGDLTRQLLAISKKQVSRPRVLDVGVSIAGLETMLRRLVGGHISLRFDIDPAAGCARIDPVHLEQILLNLAANARDAMSSGGDLNVRTAPYQIVRQPAADDHALPPGRYVSIVVQDTGVGMDPSTEARIFEPFFSTRGEERGTGLGLATVYGIVEQCCGSIRVETASGKGSTFTVLLPQIDGPPDPMRTAATGTGEAEGGERVLLVEDEVAVRAVAAGILMRAGYTVIEAADGKAALERAAVEEPVSILVTDLVMPEMNGRELGRRFEVLYPQVPVLYISGYTDGTLSGNERVELLPKPFSGLELLARVRSLLNEAL